VRIRLQLALLMLAVVTPAALVAVPSYLALFEGQRAAHAQRFLERVSALRLALENEQRHTLDMLEGHARTDPLNPSQRDVAEPRLQRLLALNPRWDVVALIDIDEREIARASRPDTPADVRLDPPTLEKTVRGKASGISDLVPHTDGRHFHAFFASPVLDDGKVVGVVYAAVEHARWLELLRTYPIAHEATLTLNDSTGAVMARTLNDPQWVGKGSRPEYWLRTVGKPEGHFENIGLEGQKFYTAFSRLRQSNWVLGTGVPSAVVEDALVVPAMMGAGGLLLALAVAAGVAVLLARRITRSLETLSALAWAEDPEAAPATALPIAEAEDVRRRLSGAIANERRARAAAERAAREKDNFLAMLAHELRNPLSAIKASVAILGSPKASADVERRAKDVLDRQVRQMAEMVNAMLDAARLSAGKVSIERRPVELSAALQRVVATFDQLHRTQHLDVQLALAPATVLGDETRLEQVFANLLDNAAKYTPAGGALRIRCQVLGSTAEVRIEDTGSGIDASLLPHVFDAFAQDARTLDRAQGGLGLGLSVVRELVQLHGGEVSAESRGVGLGATFVVRLPAIASAVPPVAEPVAPRLAAASSTTLLKPLRIAVIDDNRDNAETVAGVLRLAGHQVVTAHDGPSGIALVQGQQSEVALVDVGLPGMDGLEVARRLKAEGSRALLIAFTGYGDEKIRARIDESGFDAYLQKPFDAALFQQVVLAAWDADAARRADLRDRGGSAPS
jgi:signal transduction histidine kinase/ActR/RegA family two-component response regulator